MAMAKQGLVLRLLLLTKGWQGARALEPAEVKWRQPRVRVRVCVCVGPCALEQHQLPSWGPSSRVIRGFFGLFVPGGLPDRSGKEAAAASDVE